MAWPRDRHGLTIKQHRFAVEYVKCGNGSEAARRAGYSIRTSRQMASENLSKPDIAAFIEELGLEADAIKELTMEHVAAMILKEARTAKNEGARVRAQELLGKWKGGFVDRVEKTESNQSADKLLEQISKISPDAAEALRKDLGIGEAKH